jgi:hypothetical protein
MPQPRYKFPVPSPTGGLTTLEVPLSDFRKCPCGCSLFRQVHMVTWVKNSDHIGAEPLRLVANIFLCEECAREITSDDGCIGGD